MKTDIPTVTSEPPPAPPPPPAQTGGITIPPEKVPPSVAQPDDQPVTLQPSAQPTEGWVKIERSGSRLPATSSGLLAQINAQKQQLLKREPEEKKSADHKVCLLLFLVVTASV